MADVIDYTPTVDISDVNDEIWFDIINRTITPKDPDSIEDVLVQNDANSRNFGFMIQRYFEDEDLSTKKIRVHYVNSLNMHDVAETHSIEILGNDQDVLSFKWCVGDKACIEAGAMKFAVEFYDNTGYELYSKAITINITEGIYTHGEIPDPDDWYVTFKRELNELSVMYDEVMEKVQSKLGTKNFVSVIDDGSEELDTIYRSNCVGVVESGATYPYIYENWYDSAHDINTQYRIYIPFDGSSAGERQMRQRTYNSETNLHEWSNWKTVDYPCQISTDSFSTLNEFNCYRFKENHIYKFYTDGKVSELFGYSGSQYWLGVCWYDYADVPELPDCYLHLTNLYNGKRGTLNLKTCVYNELKSDDFINADAFNNLDELKSYPFENSKTYSFYIWGVNAIPTGQYIGSCVKVDPSEPLELYFSKILYDGNNYVLNLDNGKLSVINSGNPDFINAGSFRNLAELQAYPFEAYKTYRFYKEREVDNNLIPDGEYIGICTKKDPAEPLELDFNPLLQNGNSYVLNLDNGKLSVINSGNPDFINAGSFNTLDELRAYEFKEDCMYKIYIPHGSSLAELTGGQYWSVTYWVDYADSHEEILTLNGLNIGDGGTLNLSDGTWTKFGQNDDSGNPVPIDAGTFTDIDKLIVYEFEQGVKYLCYFTAELGYLCGANGLFICTYHPHNNELYYCGGERHCTGLINFKTKKVEVINTMLTKGSVFDTVILADRVTGKNYSLYVADGKLMIEESEV